MADVVADDLQVKDTPWVDARQYGTGSLTRATLKAAIDSITAANPKTLLISPDRVSGTGQWDIDANLTFPAHIHVRFERGAFLRLTGNSTVTFKGTLDAPLSRIFKVASGSKVRFDEIILDPPPPPPYKFASISEVYAEWWGAKGDGATDDTAEIQAALDAATSGVNSTRRRMVVLLDKSYRVNSMLTIGCDLRGQASPFTGVGATIIYNGFTACLLNPAGFAGMIIRNIRIDMRGGNDNVTGIHCAGGQVQGFFENVQILCNPNLAQHGIHIQPSGNNATSNHFINVGIENPEIGIRIGDNTDTGQGGSNIISGGIILNAKIAAIVLTGGQNAIIGGDHSARVVSGSGSTPNVIQFNGGSPSVTGLWCQQNSIVATTMDITETVEGIDYYAININADSSISQVFNATSVRAGITGIVQPPPQPTLNPGNLNFVKDNLDTPPPNPAKQRWVAVRTNAAVEARLVYASTFFASALDALSNQDYNYSLAGTGPGKALYLKASGVEATPGSILLGQSGASYSSNLPVTSNGVTLLIGPGGRIYFGRLTAVDSAVDIANMDADGNLKLQGWVDATQLFTNQMFTKNVDALAQGNVGSLIGSAPGKALYVKPSGDVTPGSILLGTPEASYSGGASSLPVTSNGVTLLVGPGGRIYFGRLTAGNNAVDIANMDVEGNLTLQGGFQMDITNSGKYWKYGSSQPAAGAGQVGDIVWNSTPQLGGKIGWVKVAETVWKAFGPIDA